MAVMCTAITVSGQEEYNTGNKTERTIYERSFEMPQDYVHVRDFVILPNKGKLIVELNNPVQYEELKHIDTVLDAVLKSVAFYKDSLEGSGSVRIDYAIDEKYSFSKMRFKVHKTDGAIFMDEAGDVSKLKLEQDTIRIYVKHNPVFERIEATGADFRYNMNHAGIYQLTFCLNNYLDLVDVLAYKRQLHHALDTLRASKSKRALRNPFRHASSSRFDPSVQENMESKRHKNTSANRLRRFHTLINYTSEGQWSISRSKDNIMITGDLGVGLIRNTFAPYAEMGLAYIRQLRPTAWNNQGEMGFSLFASSYFFFEKGANNTYYTKPNWFVNAQVGEEQGMSMGAGYLFSRSGDYFKGTTVKAFMNITMFKKRGFTLSPELIITDDFKQVFPGLTIKVF